MLIIIDNSIKKNKLNTKNFTSFSFVHCILLLYGHTTFLEIFRRYLGKNYTVHQLILYAKTRSMYIISTFTQNSN